MSSKSSKKRTERDDLPATVLVGRVGRPHGVRGEVVVDVLSDVPGRLDPGSSLLPADGEGEPLRPGARPGVPPRLVVAASRPYQGGALVRFEGFGDRGDRNRAAALTGLYLAVERSRVPPPPEGSFYRYELVGCRCRDGARELGRVVDVVEDGGGLLLIVEGPPAGAAGAGEEPDAGAAGGSEGPREARPGADAGEETRRVPIPFVERFVREIDVAAGEIVLELPEGLVEACESTS